MAHILILDSDSRHAGELVRSLAVRKHRTTTCESVSAAHDYVARSTTPLDVIVAVLSNRAVEWDVLAGISRAVPPGFRNPWVLCLERIYRGPETRLDAEYAGFRLVYERQI